MMTPRENTLRAARRQNPEWIPLDFGVSAGGMRTFRDHLGEDVDVAEEFQMDGRWIGPSAPRQAPAPDWQSLYFSDGSLPADAKVNDDWGTASVYYPESDDEISYYPLRNIETVADFEAYPWPEHVGTAYQYAGVAQKVKAAQSQGRPTYVSGLNFFESLWGLTGFEKLMMGMAAREDWAIALFRKHSECLVSIAEQIALSGADIMMTGSDVATQNSPMFSTPMWRKWIFPLMRDSISAAKAIKPDLLVLYHSDGNVEPLIEGFIEAGVDILDPVQPECMDIFALKKRYGDRLSFHGGIGVQTTLPFGTPQEVRDTVRRTIDALGANGGGYLCSSAHMIRPEVPWDNIMAFIETVREYGHP
jgi:uroporphyrinogen decarboxylase